MMRRREFITLIGGAAAWPFAARAQQPAMPVIGFLGGGTAASQRGWAAAFSQRLRELGWIEGRTVAVEYRWEGRNERYAELAAEFVRLKVDAILAAGTEAAIAAKRATSVIPIVFSTAGDPIGTGLVASLARPGGNVTGLSNLGSNLATKKVQLLREVFPRLSRLAVMVNAGYSGGATESDEIDEAVRTLGIAVVPLAIRRADCARLRVAPRACGCTLYHRRPANEPQPDAYQYFRTRCAPADDVLATGVHRIGRPNVLRAEFSRSQSACR